MKKIALLLVLLLLPTVTLLSQSLTYLSLAASRSELKEGDTFQLTIGSDMARGEAWTVSLSCNYDGRFTYPAQVEMPAGATSVVVNVEVTDNDLAETDCDVTFRAESPGCTSATATVSLYDTADRYAVTLGKVQAVSAQTDVYTGTEALAALNQTIAQLNGIVATGSHADIETCHQELLTALKQFLTDAVISRGKAFDLTGLIQNPMMEGVDGWQGDTPTILWYGESFQNAEFFNINFDIYQVLPDMPAGNYRLKVQAFQRPGSNEVAYEDYLNGVDNINSFIYINDGQTKIKNVMSEHSATCLLPVSTAGGNLWPDYEWPNGDGYTPNGMEGAKEYFDRGFYENEVLVAIDEGDLRFGFRCSDHAPSAWTLFSNFRLYYSGTAIDVTLSEEQSLQLLSDITDANITLQLTVEADKWQAFVLPFSLTAAQVGQTFGADAQVATIMDTFTDLVIFGPATAIEANVPFLLRTGTAGTSYSIDHCHVVKPGAFVVANPVQMRGDEAVQPYYYFVGNYLANGFMTSSRYVLADNQLQRSQNSDATLAYHAYLDANVTGSLPDVLAYVTDGLDPLRIDLADWQVLKQVYEDMDGETTWRRKWTFGTEPTTTRDLPGVTAENGRVVGIALSGNTMTGTFPYALLGLSALRSLSLAQNQLEGTVDEGLAAFLLGGGTTSDVLTDLNISHNLLSGNIGFVANSLPALTTLDASWNKLEDVFPVIPATVTQLSLDHQHMDRVVDLQLGSMTVSEIALSVPTLLLYNHAAQDYRDEISLTCSDNSGWWVRVHYADEWLSAVEVSTPNVYYGESGDILDALTAEGNTFSLKLGFSSGDANFDGDIDVTDLQADINYIYDDYNTQPYNFTAANLWTDEVINVQDVVKQVDLLMNTAPTRRHQTARQVKGRAPAPQTSLDTQARLGIVDGQLTLTTAVPVAALDIYIDNCSSLAVSDALSRQGFVCTTRQQNSGVHLIAYSLTGAVLPVGETCLASLPSTASVGYAVLSDRDAMAVSVSVVGDQTTTAVTSAPTETPGDVYRLPIGHRRSIIIDERGSKRISHEQQ